DPCASFECLDARSMGRNLPHNPTMTSMTQNRGDMDFPPADTLGALLRHVRRRLGEAGIEDPGLNARLLVEHFTTTTRTDAVASPERPVDAEAVRTVEAAVGRRIAGDPVHRILGWREF